MVKNTGALYLFIGEDSFSKDAKLKSIKEEFLNKGTESFNLDILYSSDKELNLTELQKKFLSLPLKAKKRIIVIKEAQLLKDDLQLFLLEYAKNPRPYLVLVLDVNRYEPKDEFLREISGYALVTRFKEQPHLDAFILSRQIELKRGELALGVLGQLLKNGEKPERILGALRHSLMRNASNDLEARKRLKLLLNCDIDIKRGRLNPAFALERVIVNLCCLGRNPAR